MRTADRSGVSEMHLVRDGGPSLMWVNVVTRTVVVYWDSGYDDAGSHAVDPDAGPGASDGYPLANGQVDEFPDRDTVPRDVAVEIVLYAFEHASRDPRVAWVDDNTGRTHEAGPQAP